MAYVEQFVKAVQAPSIDRDLGNFFSNYVLSRVTIWLFGCCSDTSSFLLFPFLALVRWLNCLLSGGIELFERH